MIESFKDCLFNIFVVTGLISVNLTLIMWITIACEKIGNFAKCAIMYCKFKKDKEIYDLKDKVIVSKDGTVLYSCVKDIDIKIEILKKGIEYETELKKLIELMDGE